MESHLETIAQIEEDYEKALEMIEQLRRDKKGEYRNKFNNDREQLIKHFVSIEFNRYLSYYRYARDINIESDIREKVLRKKFKRKRRKFFGSKKKRKSRRRKSS